MKQTFRAAALVFAILAIPAITLGQTAPQAPSKPYIVKLNDTGWDLARVYYEDPVKWTILVERNPMLKEPGRVFEKDGRIILILRPGEELVGLEELKIDPPKAVPISELVLDNAGQTNASANQATSWAWVPWALLAVAALVIAALLYRKRMARLEREEHERSERNRQAAHERELRLDPITSGPAMVPGGIPATEPARLENYFDQQAVARFTQRNPAIDRDTVRPVRIGPIDQGRIHGEGMVGYLGAEPRPRRIEAPGIDAYQARYRFQDGTEENIMCLQGCMNPVSYGTGDVYRGFTFTSNTAVVPVPEPATPAPTPAPHPQIAVRAIRTEAEGDGRSTVTIGDRVITFAQGVHFVVDEHTGAIDMDARAFNLTIQPKRRKSARPQTATRSTGTGGPQGDS